MIPTVFVVDDDRFMRSLLEQTLAASGIAVQSFESAADLLASANLQSPCVLLLDVRMPNMSGPELQLLLRERGLQIPIMFLTGSADVEVAVSAMRNGAVDFLEKPVEAATLVARVRETLRRYDPAAAASAASAAAEHADYARRRAVLTPREREVLDAMVTGATSKAMARALGGSFRTIEIHRARVMEKMSAVTLAALVRSSIER